LDFRSSSTAAILSLCGIFSFFLGFAAFTSHVYIPFIALVSVFTMTIVLSYFSRNPKGGVIIAILIIAAFFMGYLCFEIFQVSINPVKGSSNYLPRKVLEHIYRNDPWGAAIRDSSGKWIYFFLTNTLSFSEFGRLPSIISTTIAFSSIGFLFGSFGYIFQRLKTSKPKTYPLIFRDYWSQIYNWGKSNETEYPQLDRNLDPWKTEKRISEGKLRFIPNSNLDSTKEPDNDKGKLYFQSSKESIGEFIDYKKLIEKYTPKIHHYIKSSSEDKNNEINHLQKEGRVKIWVDKILGSRKIILIYFLVAFSFPFGLITYVVYNQLFESFNIISIIGVTIPSAFTFILARKFRRQAKEIVKDRSDESGLVLSIFICFFLLFATIYLLVIFIFYFGWPTYLNFELYQGPISETLLPIISKTWLLIPLSWATEFLWWAAPFLLMSMILGFAYIFVHREAENTNVYFFDNRFETVDYRIKPFNENEEKPAWLREDATPFFWVIRFMYYWRWEFTIPLSHDDWERIELWINAKNGDLKWIVSDYHYRELWYKYNESELEQLHVEIKTNFHTPVPVTNSKHTLIDASKLSADQENMTPTYFEKISDPIITKLNGLPWYKLRYRSGVNHKEGTISEKIWENTKNLFLGKDLEEKLTYEKRNSNE